MAAPGRDRALIRAGNTARGTFPWRNEVPRGNWRLPLPACHGCCPDCHPSLRRRERAATVQACQCSGVPAPPSRFGTCPAQGESAHWPGAPSISLTHLSGAYCAFAFPVRHGLARPEHRVRDGNLAGAPPVGDKVPHADTGAALAWPGARALPGGGESAQLRSPGRDRHPRMWHRPDGADRVTAHDLGPQVFRSGRTGA